VAVPDRNPAALLFENDTKKLLIDAGDGVSRSLAGAGITASSLAAVALTHTHADHAGGLFWLLQQMKLESRRLPLTLLLPEEAAAGLDAVNSWFHLDPARWSFPLKIKTFTENTIIETAGFSLRALTSDHIREGASWSFILQAGTKRVIYTGDIHSLDHLLRASEKSELLISECTHVTPEQITVFARKAGIQKVILTHIPPELMNFIPDIGGTFVCAREQETIEV